MTSTAPCIILANPQMGENIGAAARAMLNCGLVELRLVNPRDGWPNERAHAVSSGALDKMPPVQVFETLAEAIADCHHVYATTARTRDINKPVMNARETAQDARVRSDQEQKVAFLFGAERSGLSNDEVALANTIVTIPLNPDFSSLNLGQAVLLVAYEYAQSIKTPSPALEPPATQNELQEFFERFEDELAQGNFFRAPEMQDTTMRNVRAMLTRGQMSTQEVRTMHGIVSALIGNKTKK